MKLRGLVAGGEAGLSMGNSRKSPHYLGATFPRSVLEDTMEACCNNWRKAQQSGTDNEGYGRLIYECGRDGPLMMGCDLEPIKFCPWCGKEAPDADQG